jgi:hypothetical protein
MLPRSVQKFCAEFFSNFTLYMWEKWTETIVWWKPWVYEYYPHKVQGIVTYFFFRNLAQYICGNR